MKYFAYGSNCSAAVMSKKKVAFSDRKRAVLRGYRLRFNKVAFRESLPEGLAFANIEPDAEGCVEGILYELSGDQLERLDATERYPDHYDRIGVTVEAGGVDNECWTYRAQPDKTAEGLAPSRNYLNHILAAKDFLSVQYYEALDRAQTYHGECSCCHGTAEAIFIRERDNLFMLCQSCREARLLWGDVRGRKLTVGDAEAVMTRLVQSGDGFSSVQEVIAEAIKQKIIDP